MATGPASTRSVRAEAAVPGSLPGTVPARSQGNAGSTLASEFSSPSFPLERVVSKARQEELLAMTKNGDMAQVLQIAMREALQGAATGTPVLATGFSAAPESAPAVEAPSRTLDSKTLQTILVDHYRTYRKDSRINESTAWRDTRNALSFLKVLSPLMSGVVNSASLSKTPEKQVEALKFYQNSVAALSNIVVDSVTVEPEINTYQKVELNLQLAHLVGDVLKSLPDDVEPTERVVELLELIQAVYADRKFAAAHNKLAMRLSSHDMYLKVNLPEEMHSRISMSLHDSAMRFGEATGNARVKTASGKNYTYNLDRAALVKKMMGTFDAAVASVATAHQFPENLNNDQRTSAIQSWIRTMRGFYIDSYIEQTAKTKNWLMEASSDPKLFATRFKEAAGRISQVLETASNVAVESTQTLITQSGLKTLCSQGQAYCDRANRSETSNSSTTLQNAPRQDVIEDSQEETQQESPGMR